MVDFEPTPEQRRTARRYRQLERNWIRRGFTPPEAYYLISRGFDIQRARTGSPMHQFIFATIERRRRLITRLKDLDFTEKDIFNYLTEQNENREEGTEDLFQQFSPSLGEITGDSKGFLSRNERRDYINEDARKPAAILLEVASFKDWSSDRIQRLNYNFWADNRIDNINDPEERRRESDSRFENFREE